MNNKEKLIIILTLSFFILMINVNVVNAVISYTETIEIINETGMGLGWNLDYDVGSAPVNSVAEIIVTTTATGNPFDGGVRNTSSTLNRYLSLNEAEAGGNTTIRFLVQVDSSGNADFYGNVNYITFYLVGYWQDVTFQENWVSYQVGSTEDGLGVWHETDGTELNLYPERVHLITMVNQGVGKEYGAGIRNITNTGLFRYRMLMEAEGGGVQGYTSYITPDASSKIDVMAELYSEIIFYNQGYFVEDTLTFSDTYGTHNDATLVSGVWTEQHHTKLGTGKVFDMALGSWSEVTTKEVGVRGTDNSLDRKFNLGEAEGGGFSLLTMSTNVDVDGNFTLYEETVSGVTPSYFGYFMFETIQVPTILVMNNLFGAGFKDNNSIIILNWNDTHIPDNETTYYEVYHSTDNTTFSSLALTTNPNYTHTGLLNNSYHYYKIRNVFYWDETPEWLNSSFTPINFERVWFITTTNIIQIITVPESELNMIALIPWSILILIIIAILKVIS